MVKYVLSIAGGGVRGKIASSFLQELEKFLQQKYSLSIYDKFDMFVGTSTGSLIVGALAYEKLTGEEINNDIYSVKNCEKIMDKTIWDEVLGVFQTEPKYTTDGLKRVLDSVILNDKLISDTEKDVLITAFDIDNFKPIVFKSFKHDITIKKALRMSSAAPAYFPTVHDEKSGIWCIDGAVTGMNCPSEAAYSEALKIYGKEEDIRILSLGTGFKHKKGFGKESENFGGIEWVTKGDLMNIMFSAPQISVNYKMNVFTKALNHKYLHIDEEIENVTMDDVSEENINKLEEYGKQWFGLYRKKIEELFE